MPIILEERNCCLSLRCHECFSCWPQHCQGRCILGKPCCIKRAAPPLQALAPRHLQSACSTPSMLLGTHCAHTNFLQIFPSANWAPKCTFTVQAESRAVGDKGNTAPILWNPIQHTGLERLQTAQGSLLQRPSPGWPGWELATGAAGEIHTIGPCHADTLPATHFSLLPGSTLSTKQSAHLLLTIYLLSRSHFLTPNCLSRNPGEAVDGGRSITISYKEHRKTNDVVQLFTTFV